MKKNDGHEQTPLAKFHRYDGADLVDDVNTMPQDDLSPATSRLSIGELLGRFEDFCNDPAYGAKRFPWAKGFAMGFPLPSFQRDLVWTTEQKTRFIRSIWAGVDLGTYLVNDVMQLIGDESDVVFREFSEALLDGQQRLTTLEQYVTNVFAVPDINGNARYWGELGRSERRRFCGVTFTMATIKCWDEAILRHAYDIRAFGGTAHKESERASR